MEDSRASQVALVIKKTPANAGDKRDAVSVPGWGRSCGGVNANPLSILAWKIPRTEKPVRQQFIRSRRIEYYWTFVGYLFFKYKLIYFNWRLITLQYYVAFAIHQHESTTGIHVFPILKPPPFSLPVPSLWIVSMHQAQASSIMHRTWNGDSFHIWYYRCFNVILPNHPTLAFTHGF